MESPMAAEEPSPMFRDVYESEPRFSPNNDQVNGLAYVSPSFSDQSIPEPLTHHRPAYPSTLSRLPAFLRKSESQPFYVSNRPAATNPGPSFLEQAQAASSAFPIPVYASTSNQPYAHYDPSYQAQLQQQHQPKQMIYQQQLHQQYDYATPQKSRLPSAKSSKQLESLEGLLSRAGYKDTRVCTPEAEKIKDRRLAATLTMVPAPMGSARGQENESVRWAHGGALGSVSEPPSRKPSGPQQFKTMTSTLPHHPSLPPKPVGRAISSQDMRRGGSGRGGGKAGRNNGGNRHNGLALGNNRGQAQNGNTQYSSVAQHQPQQQPHRQVRKVPSAYHMDEGSYERAMDFGTMFQHPGAPPPFALPSLVPAFTATATPFIPHQSYIPPPVMFASVAPQIPTSGYSAAFDAMYRDPAPPADAVIPAQVSRAETVIGSDYESGEGSVIGVVGRTETGTPVTGRKRKVLNRVDIETAPAPVEHTPAAQLSPPAVSNNHADHSWASMEDDEDDADFDPGTAMWWRRDLGDDVVTAPVMERESSAEEIEQVKQGLDAETEPFSPGHRDPTSAPTSGPTEEASFDPAAYEQSTPEDGDADIEAFSDTETESNLGGQEETYGTTMDSTVANSMSSSNAHTEMMAYVVDEDATQHGSVSSTIELSPAEKAKATVETELILGASPPRPTTRTPEWQLSPPRPSRVLSPPRVSQAIPEVQLAVDQDALETQQIYVRQLRHAMSTPIFAKEAAGPSFSDHEKRIKESGWGTGIGLGLGNPTGWLRSIGRSWSGGSASSSTSQETAKPAARECSPAAKRLGAIISTSSIPTASSAVPANRPRAPKAMKSMGNLRRRPASPRLDKTARIVCDSTRPDELPPIDVKAPRFAQAISRRPLRAKLSLQALMGSAIASREEEASLNPVLSPRADWHDSFWGTPAKAPDAPVGFNALQQTPGKKAYYRPTNESISLGGYPDFTQSFFYSPPTPPKDPASVGSSSVADRSRPDRMIKKQQSIKSLRAHLLKGVVAAKQSTPTNRPSHIPPVPALPDAFKHTQGLSRTPPKAIQAFPPPPVLAISSPGMCDAGLPPRELVLEGEEWEGASSYESSKQRERSLRKGKGKAKRSSSLKRERA